MKPIIGICTNYSSDDAVGLSSDLGARGQDWDLIAHDYVRAVEMAGGAPLILPVVEKIENLEPVLNMLDGIIFTGGSDVDPRCYGELIQIKSQFMIETVRDAHEIKLAQKILDEMDIPVMCICRGMQLLNVACGGTLYQDLGQQWGNTFNHSMEMYPKHYPSHDLELKDKSFLQAVFQKKTIGVNSLHHQGVKAIGQGLAISATAPDGLTEGIELQGERCVFGVQFHPEMMVENDPEMLKLFKAFIEKCGFEK